MDVKENLALNLVRYRKALNLTQLELAEKLNYSDKAVSKWERGEAVPDLCVLKQIADLYQVKIDDLISKPKPIKPLIRNLGKKRVAIALWATSIVWLVAILAFCFVDIIIPSVSHTWISFIIAVPVTLIVLLVLTHVWGKNLWNHLCVSLLCWTSLLCVYLILYYLLPTPPNTLWEIFLIGIPLQALITFLFMYRKVK